MNGLNVLLACSAAAVIAVLACYQVFGAGRGASRKGAFITGFAVVVLTASIAVYASLGRWGDWQNRVVDEDVDYLLAAKITEARRKVKAMPDNINVQRSLAEAYLEGGQYKDAVEVLDACLVLGGEDLEVLGRKAFAMYYRDAKRISRETRQVIDRILAANTLDVQTRMLLGQDAYLNGRYEEAIGHWKMLLDANAAFGKEQALRNAIANAEAMMARKQF